MKYILIILILGINLCSEEPKNFTMSTNNLGFKFMKQIKKENVVFSPLSITALFGALLPGSDNITFSEIQETLNFSPTESVHLESTKKTLNKIRSLNGLSIQNYIWMDQRFNPMPKYTNISKKYFNTKLESSDFLNQPELEESKINNLIEKETNKKIINIIPSGSITKNTALILTNTIYFKDNWKTAFNKLLTRDMPFFITSNIQTKVPMMSIRNTSFSYFKNNNLQIIKLPYQNSSISMMIILPLNSIESFLKSFSYQKYQSLKSKTKKTKLNLKIPKIKLKSSYLLNDYLIPLGIKSAFKETANFSKLAPENDIYIDKAFHKAFIEIDEKGTEATAASSTVIGFKTTSISETMIVNRPYIIIIQDEETNTILFMAKITNPSTLN